MSDAERMLLLVEAVSDYAIYMLDPDGFVSTWNKGAEQLEGYRPNEIVGQHFSRFFTPEDQTAGLPHRILQETREHGRFESEGWRVRKDGSRFWATSVAQAIRDSAGELIGFAKITRDMTERRAAHEALAESERRFRLLVNGVIDYAIYMIDPSGVITNWNAGAERIKGYASREIVGQHFSRFYVQKDRAAGLPARALDLARREGRYEAEGWRLRKDGSRFWASVAIDAIRDDDGELIGFAKITRDITERQRAQDALRESERQFRLLVNGVTDYALYMLDPNGIITNWNVGAERIKGYMADEVLGQHFSRFYTDADRAAGLPARMLHLAEREGRAEAEGWRVRKDGGLFWAHVVIDAVHDGQGGLIGFAKITRDISERREAQKALQETQSQLARAQKMEALGQLTGGVAHDFNNLLMIVSGHARIVRKLLAGDPKGLRAAEAIELAAKRGESLTRQLLTFSRRQSLNPVVVSLDETIEAIRTMLASSVGTAARLVTAVPPVIWPVEVDLNELELALVNLVVNARDARSRDGVISISAENVHLRPEDTAERLEGDFVALTVADTGCGIPEDILARVFDPFFTTKQTDKGTGLGLSQVHGFAHQSGGTVVIASQVGRGTRVTLFLPRVDALPLRAEREEEVPAMTGGSVLLVEDNPEVAEATASLLEELGYRVTAVGNADAAMKALTEGEFDLVFSDIVMAGPTDGLTLARSIRARHPALPILLATGYSQAAAEGAHDFVVLRKPYQLSDLSRAVAAVLARAQQGEPPPNLVSIRDARRGRSKKDHPSSE